MSQLAVALATLDTEIESAISGKIGVAEWVRATARDRGVRFTSHPVDVRGGRVGLDSVSPSISGSSADC